MKSHLRPHNLALAALACGLAATLFAWFFAGRSAELEAKVELENHATLATSLLERRMERYVDVLYGLDALAYHDVNVSRAEFHHYVSALDLDNRFPGLKASVFNRRVPGSRRDEYVQGVRNDRSVSPGGYPKFDLHPPGDRDEYWLSLIHI